MKKVDFTSQTEELNLKKKIMLQMDANPLLRDAASTSAWSRSSGRGCAAGLTGTACPCSPPAAPPSGSSAAAFAPGSRTPPREIDYPGPPAGSQPAGHCPHCSGALSVPS